MYFISSNVQWEKKEEIISLDGRLAAERKRRQRRHGSKMD